MPYKSDAQRKMFHVLLKQGKISATTVREYDEASKGRNLPEHVSSMRNARRPRRKEK